MVRHFSNRWANRLTGFEALEPRRVLDCHGFTSVAVCVPGDSNADDQFDEQDLVHVFQAGKYRSGTPANWSEGDWNRDGTFNSGDLVTVFKAGTYLQGELIDDLSSLVSDVPAYHGPFGPPIAIANTEQLHATIDDRAAVEAVAAAADFSRQTLLFFSWSGSGGDTLIGEPTVMAGAVDIQFRFEYGLTDDLRQHLGLLAIPKEANWDINIEERVVHEDTSRYEFEGDASRLIDSGGIAGVRDEYRIEGSLVLTRSADGSARFSQVGATLRGAGLSSRDGEPLDSVLNLSELTGLQTADSAIVFSGFSGSGSAVVRLFVNVDNESLTVRGGDFPPCCDFFQHEMSATASVQEAQL